MKKVGIVTIYGEVNYGNRLQNYAAHRVLEKLNAAPVSLVAKRQSKKAALKAFAINTAYKLCKKALGARAIEHERFLNFKKFTNENIPTKYFETDSLPSSLSKEYDYFAVGSDQVWNPCFGGYEKYFGDMFLMFARPEQKLCFSPSIGISEIPPEWRDKFTEGLNTFDRINVREAKGAEIVKELTGKEAIVTLDPTLMLTAEEWLSVAKSVKGTEGSFVLDYFLGQTPLDNESYKGALSSVGTEKRIKLLDKSDRDIYVSGPAEFIYLISKATLVCTDSFHACVFSILFGKPFRIFKRSDGNKDMFSRLESLFSIFEIDINSVSNGEEIYISPEKRDSVLKEKRKTLEEYFKLLGE